MKRRELIKRLAVTGTFAFLPSFRIFENHSKDNLHFIALGSGGTNAMALFQQKGIKAQYTCITGSYTSHLTPGTKHIIWETHPDYRILGKNYLKTLTLTQEMKSVLSRNETFIILAGLGSSVGTGFIFDTLNFLHTNLKKYMAICTLPIYCEGKSKNNYAHLKKQEIGKMKNVHFVDLNLSFGPYMSMPCVKTFGIADEFVYNTFKQYFFKRYV